MLLLISCNSGNEAVPDTCSSVTYSKDIKPLVLARCAINGCHVAGFPMGNFTGYDTLKIKADNGSLRLRIVTTSSMPPLNPLSEEELNKFTCWMDKGAKNN
jgi:hypothetical protein